MQTKILLGAMALCLPLIAFGQTQNQIDAAYFDGAVKELPEKKLGKLSADADDVVQFTWEKGRWTVPYTHIKTIYLSLSRHSVLGEAFGLEGAAIGALKKRKLLLSLMLSDEQGRQRRCVFFLPRAAPREFLGTIEKKSGRKVIYESEEARLATEKETENPPPRNQ